MAVEGDIQALLEPLANGGAWPCVNNADSPAPPYIVYTVVSKTPSVSLTGPNGTEKLRVQIDVYARSYEEVKEIEAAIKTAFIGTAGFNSASCANVPISSQDLYEDDTRLYRVSMDYSVGVSPG